MPSTQNNLQPRSNEWTHRMSTNESPRNTLLPEPPPHPTKFAAKKLTWIIVGVTGCFCILVLALLFTLSDRQPTNQNTAQSDDVIALLEAETEIVDIAEVTSEDVGVALSSGGWIQQTDALGNLAQQYRCTSLDPAPANMPTGWIEMVDPDVELFLSENRVVRITGDTAIANAPNRVLESGDIYGNVKIELFEGININTQTDTPAIVMTTPQASFDNFLGEVTCESEVRIVSADHSSLIGRQLAIRFNDTNGRIEYLRLEEVDSITLYQNSTQTARVQNPPSVHKSYRPSAHHVSAGAIQNNEQYYLLTLAEYVVIKQGDVLTGKEARGNEMTIAFALSRTNSVQSNLRRPSAPLSANATIIASLMGANVEPTDQSSFSTPLPPTNITPTIITCNGGLTMLPLDDAKLMPTFPEETRLEIFGTPNTPAILIDHASDMSARANVVRYEIEQDRMDLFGDDSAQAVVTMNDATAYAHHLWISQKTGVGKIVGDGSLEQHPKTGIKTTITWQGGVDFTMTPATDASDGGILKQVICNKDIRMTTEESELTCDILDILFTANADGSSSPELAIATGNVKGISDTQTLWATKAEVTFIEAPDENKSEDFAGSIQADKMTATGDVQVLLNDGGRAFCDTLRGDINQSIAELEGNVVVAYKRMLMDRGDNARFKINRSTGKGLWEGPGQARFLTQPLLVNQDQRIKRPSVNVDPDETVDDPKAQHVSMRATWEDSMAMDQHFNNDGGLIDFRGNVIARSRQSSLELTEIQSENLQFEFTNDPLPNTTLEEDQRRVQRVIAREEAKFEHRLWSKDRPTELPVLYYIGGDHIEYETDTSELYTVGNGEMVIRDNRKPENTTHQSSLAGRGTTHFTWDGNLRTTRISDDLYRIRMTDNVQMLHKGLDGMIGMLTANTINAISKNTTAQSEKNESTVMMRGMDVREIKAEDNVYVSTTTRRVDCDIFDYNLQTGLAKLSAIEGKTVAIVTEGTPYPVRATSIVWNMDPAIDSIRIDGLQGSSTQ